MSKFETKVCWECNNYDSFGGVCLYYGITKKANETCDKFNIDQHSEEIANLKNQIKSLQDAKDILLKKLGGSQ